MVLDPFCGSGSTLVAAGLSERQFIGIELSKDHCETARGRIDKLHRSLTGRSMDSKIVDTRCARIVVRKDEAYDS